MTACGHSPHQRGFGTPWRPIEQNTLWMRQAHPSERLRKSHRPLDALSIQTKGMTFLSHETGVHRQSITLLSTLFPFPGTETNLKSENTHLLFLDTTLPFLKFPLCFKHNKTQSLRDDTQEPSLATNSGQIIWLQARCFSAAKKHSYFPMIIRLVAISCDWKISNSQTLCLKYNW